MPVIHLEPTSENRYLKQVFDHLKAHHLHTSFEYSDIPEPAPDIVAAAHRAVSSSDAIFLGSASDSVKSHIMVIMKSMGLRESVGLGTFELTARARGTVIKCGAK